MLISRVVFKSPLFLNLKIKILKIKVENRFGSTELIFNLKQRSKRKAIKKIGLLNRFSDNLSELKPKIIICFKKIEEFNFTLEINQLLFTFYN